jgi:hypothetical protein
VVDDTVRTPVGVGSEVERARRRLDAQRSRRQGRGVVVQMTEQLPLAAQTRTCTRCGEMRDVGDFYFVSKALGTRRGRCKDCMAIVRHMQKDPNWKPECSRCGVWMTRFGPGRRLCEACFDDLYDLEAAKLNGRHQLKLKPCSCCGAKRLRADHAKGSSLCPICRSVSQSRRKRLRLFNMTPPMFLALLDDQQYDCWICRQPFGPNRVPHVEHDHSQPLKVRGLVCATCNTILALARDDPFRLRGAAKFLEAPPAQYVFPGLVATPEANRNINYRPLKRVWATDTTEASVA